VKAKQLVHEDGRLSRGGWGACKVVGACKSLNAKLRAFGKEAALWGSWFGG
jgi:hypothetical protein